MVIETEQFLMCLNTTCIRANIYIYEYCHVMVNLGPVKQFQLNQISTFVAFTKGIIHYILND